MAYNKSVGEIWGERAIQAPFGLIVATYADGRSMVGGTILAPMAESQTWERWKGTAILIPQSIELPALKQMRAARMDQMMCTYLGADTEFWKKKWRST